MCKNGLFVVGAAIMMVIAVVMFFPVTGAADDNAFDQILKKLDNIPPAWSQKLPAAKRFQLVLDGAAVLDEETGLVWEKSPTQGYTLPWGGAVYACSQLEVAGRKGWHLPTIEQLASLVDTSTGSPSLPEGHPFTNVQSFYYWSATTYTDDTTQAWAVYFGNGGVNTNSKGVWYWTWCVRGGQSYDGH